MKSVDSKAKAVQGKQKARLSPELVEFLHMLNALEEELGGKSVPAH